MHRTWPCRCLCRGAANRVARRFEKPSASGFLPLSQRMELPVARGGREWREVGWLHGSRVACEGWFPAHAVQRIAYPLQAKRPPGTAELDLHAGDRCLAIDDVVPVVDGYLPLMPGLQLEVWHVGKDSEEAGWLYGVIVSKSGWFPQDAVAMAPQATHQYTNQPSRPSTCAGSKTAAKCGQQKRSAAQVTVGLARQPPQTSIDNFTDWAQKASTEGDLHKAGFAIFRSAFSAEEVALLHAELPSLTEGGSGVNMSEQRKGNGQYNYLFGLPPSLARWRAVAYEALLPLARCFLNEHGAEVRAAGKPFDFHGEQLPATLAEFEILCKRHGQSRASSLLLRYGEGGENRAHRDIYGDISYPMQLLVLLHEPGLDFRGGEFFTILQGREHRADLRRGDLLVFRTSCKHGCRPVLRGQRNTVQRHAVGLQFALRQLRSNRIARA